MTKDRERTYFRYKDALASVTRWVIATKGLNKRKDSLEIPVVFVRLRLGLFALVLIYSGLLAIERDDGRNGWNDDEKEQLHREIVDFENEKKACNVSS